MPAGQSARPSRAGRRQAAGEKRAVSAELSGIQGSPPELAGIEKAVLAAAFDPVITIDARGTILSASDSLERVFGWKPAEVLGRNVGLLMPASHRAAHGWYLSRYARSGRSSVIGRASQVEAVRRDGSAFPVELCVSRVAIAGSAGDVGPVFVGIIRDISAQKESEGALSEQQRAYETLVAHMPDIVFRLDRRLRHLFIGGAVHRLGRREPAQFIGKTARELGFPPHICDRFEAACRGVLATGEPGQLECEIGGTWFQYRLIAERSAEGSVAAVLVLAEDITERKRIEQELARHRNELESLVAARTAELEASHEQMRMADRMASIGTLAAGLGHDMNNVLLPVRARLNALHAAGADGVLPVAERKHVQEIRRSVAYLQQLADGLHFLALDPETDADARGLGSATDLGHWWSQASALLSKAVPRHVRVSASFPPGLPHAALAAHGLTQAVLNLVVNAGEAIPGPGVRKRRQGVVRVWAEASEDTDGRWVRLTVTDNGAGMTEEVKRRAFEMFFTTKRRGLGTGLGLPLVRKVVERAGGRVEIKSEAGKGTNITMIVPAVRAEEPPGAACSGPTAAISLDDGRAAALIRHMLEVSGAPVRADNDAARAHIWVVDPAEANLSKARAWRAAHPGGRLVLFGRPAPRSAGAWAELGPLMIETPDDFGAVREVIGRAISSRRRR